MQNYNLVFMGFGNVGKALAKLLKEKRQEIKERYGVDFSITGISTKKHGAIICHKGIDIESALEVNDLSTLSIEPGVKNSADFIQRSGGDVFFENTSVDYHSGQPAIDHLKIAILSGMHAITANKGPVVHAFKELSDLAASKNRKFLFESTVMDGAPIFSLFRQALPSARLLSFRGVLNSTTNMILTQMEQGANFDQAVKYCREIGIAESDPSGDIDGWDAAIKVAALVTVLMGIPLKPKEVNRTGIRGITSKQIQQAATEGKRWKLICSAKWIGDRLVAQVSPELVGVESTFYHVLGTTSSLELETDVLGLLSIVETDPGPRTTAYGLLADFINAVKS